MVKILYLVEEKAKGKPVSLLAHLGIALEKAGYVINFVDPMSLITIHQQEIYARLKKPFPLNSVKLLDYYDMVFYSLDSFHMDARECPCKTVFIYDEPWKGLRIPPGTDYIFTNKYMLDILEWNCPWEYSHIKGFMTKLRPVADTTFWKDAVNVEKTMPLAYMGNIHTNAGWNPLIKETYDTKLYFVEWAKEHLDCWYQSPAQSIDEFAETLPKVKAALHFSTDKDVGQGAWEILAAGAILLEYPKSEAAEGEGLIEGVNCYFFNTHEELKDKVNYIRTHPKESAATAIEGRKLVHEKHNIESLVSKVKTWMNKISPVKTIPIFKVPPNWSNKQIDNFVEKIENDPVFLCTRECDKVEINEIEVPSQTSRGQKSFTETKSFIMRNAGVE